MKNENQSWVRTALKKAIGATLLLAVLAVGCISLWSWASLKFVYSTGERAGFVQKFSKRGWFFKTWEGELAMVNLPGAMPEKFYFTVRRPDVAARIEQTMGHRVVLDYDQYRGLPPRVFGDTSYFVRDVRLVQGEGNPSGGVP